MFNYELQKTGVNKPVGNSLFKVNSKNTGTRCEKCLRLTVKASEQRQRRCSGALIINFELFHNLF